MTDLLFYEDSYLKEFKATIRSLEVADGVTKLLLDRTAFFPGGGGQPHDVGWIRLDDFTTRAVKVKRESGDIWHYLDGDVSSNFTIDSEINAEIDWDHRYRTMRTHTAMHILCGVVWRDYGASVTGGNMEPGKGRMDFEFESMHRNLVEELETKCNNEIENAREVRTQILPREEALQIPDLIRTKVNLIPDSVKEIRTVEIVGLDLQADGGTHVRNTNEVGTISIVDYKSKGAINKRIYLEIH